MASRKTHTAPGGLSTPAKMEEGRGLAQCPCAKVSVPKSHKEKDVLKLSRRFCCYKIVGEALASEHSGMQDSGFGQLLQAIRSLLNIQI